MKRRDWKKKGLLIGKNQSGGGYLLACAFVLVICMVLSLGMQMLKIYLIRDHTQNCLEDSIRYTVTKSWDEIFSGNRQAYAGAYQYIEENGGFEELIDRNDVIAEFVDRMQLVQEAAVYKKKTAEGQVQYQLSGLSIQIKNSTFASDAGSSRFDVEAEITITTYIRFLGIDTELQFPVSVQTAFVPLF